MKLYKVKLKVNSKKEAIKYLEQLLEKGNKQILAMNVLSGSIDENGNFIFSSKAKGAALSEFVGSVVEKSDGLYLEGEISPRKKRMILLYGLIGLNALLGLLLMFSGNIIFQMVSILFLTVPWLNVWIAKKGTYLEASLKRIFD